MLRVGPNGDLGLMWSPDPRARYVGCGVQLAYGEPVWHFLTWGGYLAPVGHLPDSGLAITRTTSGRTK